MRAPKPIPVAFVSLCALAVGCVLPTTVSVANPPEAPEVTVESPVPATTATLHGFLNPRAPGEAGTYEFLYKASKTECRGEGHAPASPGLAFGAEREELPSEVLSGLKPDTEYTVCLRVEDTSGEEAISPGVRFKTALPPEAPVTSPAKSVAATSAVLQGTLNPGAKVTAGWYFAYKAAAEAPCTGGSETAREPEAEVKAMPVSEEVTGLEPNSEYVFCLVASNAPGETAVGNEVSFKTLLAPPAVDVEQASAASSTGATLEAQVNPNNQVTTYSFEYSTKATGETLEGTIAKLDGASALPAGFGDQTAAVSTGAVLQPGTTYFYRVVAESAAHERTEGEVSQFTTVPTPHTGPASAIAATTATFTGDLTLDSLDTQYSFDYKAGNECASGSTTPEADAGVGAAGASESASATGLQPDVVYSVCFVTANAFGSEQGPPATFRTLPEAYATDVSSSAATLHAVLDPEGQPTTYRFEYGTSDSYGSETPASAAGDGPGAVSVEFHQQNLLPATTYHFRVLATSAGQAAESADGVFTTQATGEGSVLPDGRQWELVSPPEKEGGRLIPPTEGEGLVQTATSGSAIAYSSELSPTEPEPQGFTLFSQVLSVRTADGWSSRDIDTPHDEPTGTPVGKGSEYRLFSSDLSLGLVEPFGHGDPPLSAKASERTMYVRDDAPVMPEAAEQALYGEAEAEAYAGSGVGYLPLVDPADVPTGVQFGGTFGKRPRGVYTEGATPDLSHVLFVSEAPLTPKAVETGLHKGLYEWSGGRLRLVSVLPGVAEEPVSGNLGGFKGLDARNAISADGARVFWTAANGILYMRDAAQGETIQLDAAEPGCGGCGGGGGQFQTASSDGSKVFFTDEQRLTSDAGSGGDLYECEIVEEAGKPKCDLRDLTPLTSGESAGVDGSVLGASEDGGYVYIVANGALAQGATPGQPNLYALHGGREGWTTRFIATLSGADFPDWSATLPTLSARVSPNGRYLEFMSQRSLTGYDNLDANTGQPDEEVYLYHAESSQAGTLEPGRLICASCNPSGARPVGVEANETELIDANRAWASGLAADVPGWVGLEVEAGRYQPRYLSDGGRLFFNGVDPLVPQAANGAVDVYEYEPAGEGSCTSSSGTFNNASGGCVALISGASSGEESVFLDASENGDDVFFLTSARLTRQDLDTAYDVYDAHVCSAVEPCPTETVAPPPCTTADACRAAPTPQPAIFGAPASATFSGTGNASTTAIEPKPTTCRKGFVKKKGKCVTKRRVKKRKTSKDRLRRRAARSKARKPARSGRSK